MKNDEKLNDYLMQLWSDMRGWLKEDLDSPNSRVRLKITESGQWLGQALEQDEKLRASLNLQMETVAARMAPDFAEFLTRHISDTVKSWDARDMSRQIELNIGKDLQFIRINGTLVGAFIGLILYLLSQLPVVMPWVLARL
ncbi:Predicted membrane protein [Ewingella americana]|uniref:Predicted membrane protein n=1 Tax=Ewingella americana TaxID=41202 RepID=A0A377NEL4_9GAMM|nr:Predicted membrane protein [Ewingella americana]